MKISELRKRLSDLVDNLPREGIPIEKKGKVVAMLLPIPKGLEGGLLSGTFIMPDGKVIDSSGNNLSEVQKANAAQRKRDDLLRGINRKSRW